jgi:hypothetical protein
MKLNFTLDKLELYLEEEILHAAEILIGTGALKSVSEIEKNLFLVRYTVQRTPSEGEGDEKVETEVQLSGSKVKMATCDCQTFSQNDMCPHIAASLLEILEHKKQQADSRKAKAKPLKDEADNTPRLTIPNILKRVEAAQLREFIADYARGDKQFALALKTRFASDMSSGDMENHYKTLIENTLKSVKNPKGRITPKGWLQVFTMLDELKQKAESLFKTGELNLSFDLVRITLPLVHRFMRGLESPKAKLERRQVQLTEILRGFEGLLVSPELSERLWDFHVAEYVVNVRHEFSDRLFDWLSKQADSKNRLEALLDTIENQLIATRQFRDTQNRLLTQKIQVLQKAGRVEEASTLILNASANPEVLFFAIENSLANGDWALAKSLSQNGLSVFKKKPMAVDRLEMYLLDIAEKQGDTEGVILFAEKKLLSQFQFEFYQKLKNLSVPTLSLWAIIEKLENKDYRIEKRDVLARIYTAENRFDKLEALILELASLELLRRHGVDLWLHNPAACLSLHKKVLYEYLYSHLGRPPAQRIRQILTFQYDNGGVDLVQALIKNLKADFPERLSLKEELDDMVIGWEKQLALKS